MEDAKIQKIKIEKWDAFLIFDDENNQYTLSYAGEGGAICSDNELDTAIEKFKEMMHLAESVKKLNNFSKTGKL